CATQAGAYSSGWGLFDYW
nr:immunoglobulin heavy chain junction region [Macaca mulatta]MOV38728.1 immunoglobulin heavy chain junction region [Macaca mulatta]MOV42305.1 immunoglobulin heavy chain junction region [Macaca mulatta]MOV42310.1 immunoglobulin heavy chain junction region [Macaca mulatta]MOV47144.1 immunoglobulin heavy chain junction region [Macaca mulatta]